MYLVESLLNLSARLAGEFVGSIQPFSIFKISHAQDLELLSSIFNDIVPGLLTSPIVTIHDLQAALALLITRRPWEIRGQGNFVYFNILAQLSSNIIGHDQFKVFDCPCDATDWVSGARQFLPYTSAVNNYVHLLGQSILSKTIKRTILNNDGDKLFLKQALIVFNSRLCFLNSVEFVWNDTLDRCWLPTVELPLLVIVLPLFKKSTAGLCSKIR
ncbi:hypothetical protein GEMRC1_011372 [Eukaryota sp. GEM-RC1]